MNIKSRVFIILLLLILLTGCKSYMKFEIGRYFIAFFITLLIGIIGLIVTALRNKRK